MATPAGANNFAGVQLSAIMRAMIADLRRARPPTLAEVRAEVEQSGMRWTGEGELQFPQDRTSLVIEIDELIGRYGADAPATSALRPK